MSACLEGIGKECPIEAFPAKETIDGNIYFILKYIIWDR